MSRQHSPHDTGAAAPQSATFGQTSRGPRFEGGKVLARSILGDPEDWDALSREQTRVVSRGDGNVDSSHTRNQTPQGSAVVPPLDSFNLLGSTAHSAISGQENPNTRLEPATMDKEAELRAALMTLAETKRKEREEQAKRLNTIHVFQRFDEVREGRILRNHEKRRNEWETFRRRMARRLNKDMDDLVFSRFTLSRQCHVPSTFSRHHAVQCSG